MTTKSLWGCCLCGWALLHLFAPLSVFALDPSRSLFQYNIQTWKRQNGLPAIGVNAVVQTKDGYLWLGAPVGLVRFDGSEFKLLDLSEQPQFRSGIVNSISASKSGGLWFGLERGAFGFCDGQGLSFRGKDDQGGLNQNVHAVLETGDGAVWVAAETLSGKLTKDNSYQALPAMDAADFTAVCQGSDGRVWLGTARRGLHYWKDGALHEFGDASLKERIIRALAEDRQGRLWVGTEMGLLCYDSNLNKLPLPYPWYQTVALWVDGHGAVWAATSGGGVVRFLNDVASPQFRQVDGLADDFVNAIAEDHEGSLWIGTRNGLSQLSDVKIPVFGKAEGLVADVDITVCSSRRGGLTTGATTASTPS